MIRSELEDWFVSLGEQRNAIIHQGEIKSYEYRAPPERPQSRYAGEFFWIADRILRETVKALLGTNVLLCGLLEDVKNAEKLEAIWDELIKGNVSTPSADNSAGNLSITTSKNEPMRLDRDASAGEGRELKTLLDELQCDAANKIQLDKVTPLPASTEEESDVTANSARRCWQASFQKHSMRINKTEKDTLEAAGAEFSLPQHWTMCE